MSDSIHSGDLDRRRLGLFDRAAFVATLLLALLLFLTVGWMTLAPTDPLGAVSLVGHPRGWWTLFQAAALAAVTAGLATLVGGRRLVDIGPFSVAIGLAAASLKGGTTAELLLTVAAGPAQTRALGVAMAREALAWFVVMATAMAVSSVVSRWLGQRVVAISPHRSASNPAEASIPAGHDVPVLSTALLGVPVPAQTGLLPGLQHALVASAVGIAAVIFLSSGTAFRSITHGQACFVAAGGIGIGAYVAHRVAPARSALWSLLAVPVVAITGFLWAAWSPWTPGRPPTAPTNPFLRILPIQFIAMGAVSAIGMLWYLHAPLPAESEPADSGSGVSQERQP